MLDTFKQYLLPKAVLTTAELDMICSLAQMKKLRRRQFLLQEGEVCQHKIFVTKGLLRTYRLANDGTEHIMRFATENNWSIDHESYTNRTPSLYYIEAIEDAEVLLWERKDMNALFETTPAFRLFSEQLREQSINVSQQRILANLSFTAEEKYLDFIRNFPNVFNRVPLHMVASYLGVSRETLSRVRQGLLVGAKQ